MEIRMEDGLIQIGDGRIVLSKESSSDQIRAYFEVILRLYQSHEKYPVNLDDVWPLLYSEKSKAVRALRRDFFENDDFVTVAQNGEGGRFGIIEYHLTVNCMEYFIARKVREVFDVYRNVFKKVATGDVKVVSSLNLPDFTNPAEAARAWAEQYEQKQLEAKRADEAEAQVLELSQEIATMKPKVSYYDTILNNPSTVLVTQIAQDYGMSAIKFNQLLYELHIQHKVNDQWILYAEYLRCGYVQSKPVTIEHTDGSTSVKYNTEWTQKGRLFLYEKLKEHDIFPLIEQKELFGY